MVFRCRGHFGWPVGSILLRAASTRLSPSGSEGPAEALHMLAERKAGSLPPSCFEALPPHRTRPKRLPAGTRARIERPLSFPWRREGRARREIPQESLHRARVASVSGPLRLRPSRHRSRLLSRQRRLQRQALTGFPWRYLTTPRAETGRPPSAFHPLSPVVFDRIVGLIAGVDCEVSAVLV